MGTCDCLIRGIFTHYENTSIRIYSKFYHQKNENVQIKNPDIFQISGQNINCKYSLEPPIRGGSNEYPQSMFLSGIRQIMYTSVNPSFTIEKWGSRGSKLKWYVFVMAFLSDLLSYCHVRCSCLPCIVITCLRMREHDDFAFRWFITCSVPCILFRFVSFACCAL